MIKRIRLYFLIYKIRSHNGVCFGGYMGRMAWFVSPHAFCSDQEKIMIRFLRIKKRLVFSGNYQYSPMSRYDLYGDKRIIFNII